MQLYTVKATTCGNPDFRQDPRQKLYGAQDLNVTVPAGCVKSAFREWITDNEVGGGNLPDSFVYVRDDKGEQVKVAHISYNGRLWTPEKRYEDRQPMAVDEEGTIVVAIPEPS